MESFPRPTFRVVVVAPLAPPADHRTGAPLPVATLPVDAEGLDGAVAACAGTLRLRVANRIDAQPAELDVALPITSMVAFRPEAVAVCLPNLAPWLALQRLLDEAAGGRLTVEQLVAQAREEVADRALVTEVEHRFSPGAAAASSPPAARSAPPGAVDSILDMVDLPPGVEAGEEARPADAASALARLTATWGGGRGHGADPRALAEACDAVDRQISLQLDEVFSDPRFRDLERAWRGVALLVGRLGRCEGVRLGVVAAPEGEEATILRTAVVEPWYGGEAEVPPALVVVARLFSNAAASLASLAALAELGEEVQAPVVVEVGERFFGDAGVAAIPSLAIHLDGDAYAGWRSLRDKDASSWLAAVYNRVCLRGAYGAEDGGRGSHHYREAAGPLWGSAALLPALLAGEAFGASGWPGAAAGEVEDLCLSPAGRATEALLAAEEVAILGEHGITSVAPVPGRDRVRLAPAVTVHRPRQLPSEQEGRLDRARSDLAYPLVVGQLVALLHHLTPRLAGRSDGEAVAAVEAGYRGRLGDSATIEVAVADHPERAERRLLQLAVTPPASILASRAVVEMAVAIPR